MRATRRSGTAGFRRFAETRRICRPDLLGCGASDVPAPAYRFTPEKIEAELFAIFEAMSLSRVHWVGESSGGIIGLLLAAAHPERIASLVLCNTPSGFLTRSGIFTRWARKAPRRAIRAHGVGEWFRRTLGYRLDPEHATVPLREWCIAEMGKTRPDIAAALHECFEGIDVQPLLTRITAPVLLLSGDKSRIALRALASEPIVLLEEGHCLRKQSLSICQAAGLTHHHDDVQAAGLETLRQMVMAGIGIALVPEMAALAPFDASGLAVYRRFEPPEPTRELVLAWRRSFPRGDTLQELVRGLRGALAAARAANRVAIR